MSRPETRPPRAADHLARRLFEAGCRHAFGMPGGEVLTVMDALARAGIEVVLARHENAAAFMAEGVWQRTGAPGIVVATLGPGVLNGVNAIANAHQDRVRLIVISGCVDADEGLTYTHQTLDHLAVDFGHHDFAAIGRAFGGHGVRVSNRAELRAALQAAQQADRFTVIAAEIDRGSYDNRI